MIDVASAPLVTGPEMPRAASGKRKSTAPSAASSSSTTLNSNPPSSSTSSSRPPSSSSSSSSSPLPPSEDALHDLTDPYLPYRGNLNSKRIRADPPSFSSFSPTKLSSRAPSFPPSSFPLPPPHPPSHSSATSLVSNAELDLHSSPEKSEFDPPLTPQRPVKDESELSTDLPELESDLPTSNLSSTLSPSSALYPSPAKRRHSSRFSALLSPGLLQSPPPSSHSFALYQSTPSKARFSPSSGGSPYYTLSPLEHHPRRSPRLTPPSRHSLFHSPSPRTPRSSLITSPSPSRPRSLTAMLNQSSLPSPLPPSPLPSLMLGELITPTGALSSFMWGEAAPRPLEPAEPDQETVTTTPNKRKKATAATSGKRKEGKGSAGKGKSKGPAKGKGKGKSKTAPEVNEDSADSLAVLLPRMTRDSVTPTLPSISSPSREFSFPSTSLLSTHDLSRGHLLHTPSFDHSVPSATPLTFRLHQTPSSAASRASTVSSSSSKRTRSFSIIGAPMSSPATPAVRSSLLPPAKLVRQRLTYEGDDAQQGKEEGKKEEEVTVKTEGETKEVSSASPAIGARRQYTTEFIMSEDGLLEQSTSHPDAEQRSLFAYRASAGVLTPARFPPSPPDAALSPYRPRSYTFAKRTEAKMEEPSAINPSSSASDATAPAPLSPPSTEAQASPCGHNHSSSDSSHPPTSDSTGSSDPAPSSSVDPSSADPSISAAVPPSSSVALTPAQLLQSVLLTSSSAHPSGVISIDGVPVKAKSCACKKSQCG